MKRKKKTAQPKVKQFNLRLSEEDYDLIIEAAGDYPPTTWARVALLRAAREVVRNMKGGES